MKQIILAAILCSITFAANPVSQNEWPRYVPPKQQKEILKKAVRSSSTGNMLLKTSFVSVYWVTESVARAFVSATIDKERITNDEADAKFNQLRKEGSYSFVVFTVAYAMSAPFGKPRTANETTDPIGKADFFLQRADDHKAFSKASVEKSTFDVFVDIPAMTVVYNAILPKADRAGKPIVRGLDDKTEVQLSLSGKSVVLDYKVKDLVTRLEDL